MAEMGSLFERLAVGHRPTVREDYSQSGDAWDYLTHDQARSRAYRWGEDGLAGISDDQQLLCFALALWNGRDPILKERLFGLTNSEGNHGDNGAGLCANHQTGWTGLIVRIIQFYGSIADFETAVATIVARYQKRGTGASGAL